MFDYSYHCNKRRNHPNRCGQFQVPQRYHSEDDVRSFQRQSGPYHRTPATQLNFAGPKIRPDREMRSLACAVYQRNVRVTHTQVPHKNQKSSCPQSQAQAPVNVSELFQKLVASGLIPVTNQSFWFGHRRPSGTREAHQESQVQQLRLISAKIRIFGSSAVALWGETTAQGGRETPGLEHLRRQRPQSSCRSGGESAIRSTSNGLHPLFIRQELLRRLRWRFWTILPRRTGRVALEERSP